ncbi:peptide ABC transporter permease [Paenibacillus swuensis]|uniref:Peptide ABC transporter permease n=1 Tax=Paenibacillus swuensis TaxID=1178515 RepID=A0A172TPY8_9BACL|nr:peptide ABC transporter permease [Paenibacillus swuensis]
METRSAAIWKRFRKNKLAVAGLIIFALLVLMAIMAPWISPHDPEVFDIMESNLPPSALHPFGTDSYGADILTRIFYGARVSLSVAIIAMTFTVTIGVLYGAISGYFGGLVDNIMMRIVDAIQSTPTFFFTLIVATLMVPGMWTVIIALTVFGWTRMARIVRGEILSLKERDYIEAARASGESNASIIFYHVLPNMIGPIIVIATLDVAGNILAESTLSFLGLGIQPPTPSWGNMLTSAQDLPTIMDYAWIAVFPGLFIVLAVLSVNFIGDGLRDALDPRSKK